MPKSPRDPAKHSKKDPARPTRAKAHRPDAPADLIPQFPLIREAVRAFDIPSLEQAGFEADDLIATYVRQACERGATATEYGLLVGFVDENGKATVERFYNLEFRLEELELERGQIVWGANIAEDDADVAQEGGTFDALDGGFAEQRAEFLVGEDLADDKLDDFVSHGGNLWRA